MRNDLPLATTLEVRDRCLCLSVHRAARAISRHFDDAFRRFALSHGQFSLLITLNRPEPPRVSEVSKLLGMDRTTLTANLKPLKRRGLVRVKVDEKDRRGRRLMLTKRGGDLLVLAVPVWRAAHDALDAELKPVAPEQLRANLLPLG
jgi:DNA-binding MarR family transcriptional regulator